MPTKVTTPVSKCSKMCAIFSVVPSCRLFFFKAGCVEIIPKQKWMNFYICIKLPLPVPWKHVYTFRSWRPFAISIPLWVNALHSMKPCVFYVLCCTKHLNPMASSLIFNTYLLSSCSVSKLVVVKMLFKYEAHFILRKGASSSMFFEHEAICHSVLCHCKCKT